MKSFGNRRRSSSSTRIHDTEVRGKELEEVTMNIYEEARRRILETGSTNVPKKAVSETQKASNRKRVAKYARTEKGRASNARRCRKYRSKSKDRLADYFREWNDAFEREHGIKYCTYRYRVRHGLPVTERFMQ